MPSYRSILTVTVLKPGHAPEDVESAARNAVRRMTVLESFQIGIVRGRPRVTVRFTSIDDAEAREVHAIVVDEVRKVAQVEQVLDDERLAHLRDLPRRELWDLPDPRFAVMQEAARRARCVRVVLRD